MAYMIEHTFQHHLSFRNKQRGFETEWLSARNEGAFSEAYEEYVKEV